MDIQIQTIPDSQLKKKPTDDSQLKFGEVFTDYMFMMNYTNGEGWHDPVIQKFENFSLSPASSVFHYAQEVFEGLKAYYRADGRTGLFRPDRNYKRLNHSAQRLCMPEIPADDHEQALFELLSIDRDWIPKAENTSLYIRPTLIATNPVLSVHSSLTYLFFIILSPSGPYYSKGFLPISVYITKEFVRAAPSGTGNIKSGGNYAGSLLAGQMAIEKGCEQVLWLDPIERRYIEEVGSMNIFFVYGKKVITSKLTGTILEGVTRDSVLLLAKDLGYEVEERSISIDGVIEDIKSGAMTECFGCGTAAVISPVGKIVYEDITYLIGDEPRETSKLFFRELTDIQYGRVADRFGWTVTVD